MLLRSQPGQCCDRDQSFYTATAYGTQTQNYVIFNVIVEDTPDFPSPKSLNLDAQCFGASLKSPHPGSPSTSQHTRFGNCVLYLSFFRVM